MKDTLDKYVVLAAVDMHVNPGGQASFSMNPMQLQDAAGNQLKLVADADMPPVLTGTLASLRAMMAQLLGSMGKGMQVFAYESGSVRACEKGSLSVIYDGETYTYDTPIPGCPAN